MQCTFILAVEGVPNNRDVLVDSSGGRCGGCLAATDSSIESTIELYTVTPHLVAHDCASVPSKCISNLERGDSITMLSTMRETSLHFLSRMQGQKSESRFNFSSGAGLVDRHNMRTTFILTIPKSSEISPAMFCVPCSSSWKHLVIPVNDERFMQSRCCRQARAATEVIPSSYDIEQILTGERRKYITYSIK